MQRSSLGQSKQLLTYNLRNIRLNISLTFKYIKYKSKQDFGVQILKSNDEI